MCLWQRTSFPRLQWRFWKPTWATSLGVTAVQLNLCVPQIELHRLYIVVYLFTVARLQFMYKTSGPVLQMGNQNRRSNILSLTCNILICSHRLYMRWMLLGLDIHAAPTEPAFHKAATRLISRFTSTVSFIKMDTSNPSRLWLGWDRLLVGFI